jgi:signal transduction histidine kinase
VSNRQLVRPKRLRLWPRSLASRTAVILLAGLILVEGTGLTIYTLERFDLQRLAEAEELGTRVASLYRSVVTAPPDERQAALRELDPLSSVHATLDPTPATSDLPLAPQPMQQAIRISLQGSYMPQALRWTQVMVRGSPMERRMLISMHLPTEDWLNIPVAMPHILPFFETTFLVPFLLMAAVSTALVAWAMRQFSAPMRELAAAAEQLGTDVNMPPMAETGPTEFAKAARAFNTMAERIRRFVRDRTFLLTAIGHDLRTPITRLKLRAEWMEDEEQRDKMLADLDELEGMVAATLAFGRDDAAAESMRALDLAELLRTILDEAGDARSCSSEMTSYEGPDHQVVRARPVSIKRALSNLVANALNYGGSARVCLMPPKNGMVTVLVEDAGPGIPPGELERVFEPFHRLETSRNRETGGTGLGLPIARNILRAHGGDVVLANRPSGGVRASVTLPA